mgnify:CR=1 FL=1
MCVLNEIVESSDKFQSRLTPFSTVSLRDNAVCRKYSYENRILIYRKVHTHVEFILMIFIVLNKINLKKLK